MSLLLSRLVDVLSESHAVDISDDHRVLSIKSEMGFCASAGQGGVGILNDVVRFGMLASALYHPNPRATYPWCLELAVGGGWFKVKPGGREVESLCVSRQLQVRACLLGWSGECLFTSNPNTKVQS